MGWIELFGLEEEEPIIQKRILSIVSGAVLPIVALGFIKSLTDYVKVDPSKRINTSVPEGKEFNKPYPIHTSVEDTREIEIPNEIIPVVEETQSKEDKYSEEEKNDLETFEEVLSKPRVKDNDTSSIDKELQIKQPPTKQNIAT